MPYQWKSKYGALAASKRRRVKECKTKNAQRKGMVAALTLDRVARTDGIF